MRVLHCAALLTPPSGILRQMEWEQHAADELGLEWQVRMYCPGGSADVSSPICVESGTVVSSSLSRSRWSKLIGWIKHRRDYTRWVSDVANQYDVLLLRYYVHDPFQWLLVRSIRKPIFFVHHTKEVNELASAQGIGGWVRSALESLIGPCSLRSATGTVAVTGEILEYERKRVGGNPAVAFVYPNGIITGKRLVDDQRAVVPEILFVASEFHSWHGLDLLLDAASKFSGDFTIHLVGNLSNEDRVRAERDERIVLHGHLSGEQIRQIASRCHLGLSSFALHRKGMNEACTLKVREYLDMGLPVYAGHRDVFPESFPFYRVGPPDIQKIIAYALECAGSARQEIADSAKPFIDKKALLENLYSNLLEVLRK